ncbi:MAG: PhzF family phenazine biosynthesis protein [Cyclobacteriaceae bacterium]|nr:PhzF family phenazine biosynthesis isomerase [Cyclobacteriaceae bacterium]MCH8515746.1 PhzF family phenazine biosynthesis protein [Cyclobacteriaceae bacterium]
MKIYTVDAFAPSLFKGNPAAVCFPEKQLEDAALVEIAAEMNLSETAFLYPRERSNEFDIRWFTPTKEVALCGHATLAAAKVIFSKIHPNQKEVLFHSKSGQLPVQLLDSGKLAMDFPAAFVPEQDPEGELVAHFAKQKSKVIGFGKTMKNGLIELDSERAVREYQPDLNFIAKQFDQGMIITAKGSPNGKYDFISRYFAPNVGVNEDPVTGSTHTLLTPYWQKRLNKSDFFAYQASKRGGELWLKLSGDRVLITGEAQLFMEATIYYPK